MKNIKWMLLTATVLCGIVFLFNALFSRDFPVGSENLTYTRQSLLGTPSKGEGELFVDKNGDLYIITDNQELLRQRGAFVIAETVIRADANEQGLVWLNASKELYLHCEGKTLLLSDGVCEFALNEDSVFYYGEDGNLYACTPENNGILFDYSDREYPAPRPETMELLANNRWVFISGARDMYSCYYDLTKDCLVVMDERPYFDAYGGTAVLWNDYLLCLMGFADGGMLYHLAEGIGQRLDLNIDASECNVRGSAVISGDALYLSVQYEPFPQFVDLPIQEATFSIDATTLEIVRIDDTFYTQLFAEQKEVLGLKNRRRFSVLTKSSDN